MVILHKTRNQILLVSYQFWFGNYFRFPTLEWKLGQHVKAGGSRITCFSGCGHASALPFPSPCHLPCCVFVLARADVTLVVVRAPLSLHNALDLLSPSPGWSSSRLFSFTTKPLECSRLPAHSEGEAGVLAPVLRARNVTAVGRLAALFFWCLFCFCPDVSQVLALLLQAAWCFYSTQNWEQHDPSRLKPSNIIRRTRPWCV